MLLPVFLERTWLLLSQVLCSSLTTRSERESSVCVHWHSLSWWVWTGLCRCWMTLPRSYSNSPGLVPSSVIICLLSPVPVVPLISSVRLPSVYKGQRRCASFWLQTRKRQRHD